MRTIYAICIAAAMLFSTASFSQPFKMYLKIDGIPGSSTSVHHQNEIDVFSYSTGLSSCPVSSGNGSNVCKAFISELNMMIKMEKALIPLKMAVLQGQVIAFADLVLESGSATPFTFFRMRMEQVTVTSTQESGSEGGDNRPTVSLSLGFGKVAWEYIEQKPDGSAGFKNSGGWDIKANKPWTYFPVN